MEIHYPQLEEMARKPCRLAVILQIRSEQKLYISGFSHEQNPPDLQIVQKLMEILNDVVK